jgi:CRP/FNR family transcriptional regulator
MEPGTRIPLKEIKRSCENCSLNELCLPYSLPMEEIKQLEAIVARQPPLATGAHLFNAGAPFRSLYAVRTGSFKVFGVDEAGNEQILGFHFPGDLMGLDALASQHHRCTAEALENSAVCAVPYTQLESLSMQLPGLHRQMMRIMSREIAHEGEMLMATGKKQAEARLAGFLVGLSRRMSDRGLSATDFHLPMSRADLGNYLGLAVETVSRLFTRFQEQGLLSVNRKDIRLLNLSALKHMSAPCNDD